MKMIDIEGGYQVTLEAYVKFKIEQIYKEKLEREKPCRDALHFAYSATIAMLDLKNKRAYDTEKIFIAEHCAKTAYEMYRKEHEKLFGSLSSSG